eukprot:390368_1
MATSVSRKQLLHLTKSQIIKKCKKAKLSTHGSKGDMVNRLIQHSTKQIHKDSNKTTKKLQTKTYSNKKTIRTSTTTKSFNIKSLNVQSYLDVFETNPSGSCGNKSSIKCDALARICVGLKYYQALFTNKSAVKMSEEETKNVFVHFNDMVYNKNNKKQLLDDWIHILKQHNDSTQIIEIQNELKSNYNIENCSISQCKILTRHYRARGVNIVDGNNKEQKEEEQDAKYEFYCDCYHKFHHQIFHLFQMGLRA